jgi:hypothetical protein
MHRAHGGLPRVVPTVPEPVDRPVLPDSWWSIGHGIKDLKAQFPYNGVHDRDSFTTTIAADNQR